MPSYREIVYQILVPGTTVVMLLMAGCQPSRCNSNADCLKGEECDIEQGVCVPSSQQDVGLPDTTLGDALSQEDREGVEGDIVIPDGLDDAVDVGDALPLDLAPGDGADVASPDSQDGDLLTLDSQRDDLLLQEDIPSDLTQDASPSDTPQEPKDLTMPDLLPGE